MVSDIHYQDEIKKCKTIEDVVDKNGLMQRLLKDVIQQLLEAEMDGQLSRQKYQRASDRDNKNYRNGYSRKNIDSSFGELDLDVPRDRKSEKELKISKKLRLVLFYKPMYILIIFANIKNIHRF